MNRRSVLRWLGLAPVAAPAVVAAASSLKPAAEPMLDAIGYEPRAFSFDGTTLCIPSLRVNEARITSEARIRAAVDEAFASRIDSPIAHIG